MATDPLPRMDRRVALKWMLAAAATATLAPHLARSQASAPSHGYGTDPDLLKHYKPGDVWPLTFTDAQRRTAAALCDAIIPADTKSLSASAVGVVDFLDEWISAPYPGQQADRSIILAGLAWIDQEAVQRFTRAFSELEDAEKSSICDAICFQDKARPEYEQAAKFFAAYRNLTAGGFYTTPEGRNDLRYVGNMPLATFEGPPAEVLQRAGLI